MKKAVLFFLIFYLFSVNLNSQNTELWGMSLGGENSRGSIFKTDTYGNNQELQYSFGAEFPGARPYANLCEASNGKFYGMTSRGGMAGGVLFEYDPTSDAYTIKVSFEITMGNNPQGSLIKASNGKLYGMTYGGGTNGYGVLFEYDPILETYTKKIDFNGTNGKKPWGSLMQASNGKLYGMTSQGGFNNNGLLFEYNPTTGILAPKIYFDGTSKGQSPTGDLMQATNGMLYGMTFSGGLNYGGVIFEYDPVTDNYTKKHDFDWTSGYNPRGSLVQASNGMFYGMTESGGTGGNGVLFEFNHSTNNYTVKLLFDTSKGIRPHGSLLQASNGKLYGMTRYSGASGSYGTLFEYNITSDTYTKKFDFIEPNNGKYPRGGLTQASNGKLYGMTYEGGLANQGVIFEYNPTTDIYSKKLDFSYSADGILPKGSLVQASSGKLYGMTERGGINDDGVLFEYDPAARTYTKIIDFEGVNKGQNPVGNLMQASNGKLYGMTASGGVNGHGYGVLFEFDPVTDIFSKKIDFDGVNKGRSPQGSLIQASNGKLYGMTRNGGTSDYGVLFEYDLVTETFSKKIDFIIDNGALPHGNLIQASNGKLYGMTTGGGKFPGPFNPYQGVLFEYDTTTDIYTVKFEFDNVYNPTNPFSFSGKNPLGSLIQSTNGKLYGMTIYGGTSNIGVVFEFDPVTDTYSKKLDFDGSNGKNPEGSLMQASNGNLYGMTRYGGTDNVGVIFEFDSATDTYSKKLDFNYYNGFGPLGGLIEINADVLIIPDIANLPDVDAQCEVTAISPPTANNGAITATTSTTFPIATQGVTVIIWTYDDGNENSTTQEQNVIIDDNIAPVITVNSNQITLWPPNHNYETIGLSSLINSVSDNCANLSIDDVFITNVSSDEVEDAVGDDDGMTVDDIVIASDCQSVELRRERSGVGNGRVYAINFEANDGNGNTSTESYRVFVPHNKGGATIDDGMAYEVICGNANKSPISNINKKDILLLNHPNPFKGTTTILFSLKESNYTKLKVYNYLGVEIATIFDGVVKANKKYQLEYNGYNLPGGVYFYQLQSGPNISITKKMVIMK